MLEVMLQNQLHLPQSFPAAVRSSWHSSISICFFISWMSCSSSCSFWKRNDSYYSDHIASVCIHSGRVSYPTYNEQGHAVQFLFTLLFFWKLRLPWYTIEWPAFVSLQLSYKVKRTHHFFTFPIQREMKGKLGARPTPPLGTSWNEPLVAQTN